MNDDDMFVDFSTYSYKGKPVEGVCSDWSNFATSTLTLSFSNLYFSSVTGVYGAQPSLSNPDVYSNKTAVCNDKNIIARMVTAFIDRTMFYEPCNGDYWRVYSCSYGPIICVNCLVNCWPSNCPGSAPNLMNPCNDCSFKYPASESAAFAVLKFDISVKIEYPEIASPLIMSNVTRNSMIVNLNVTARGSAFCAAFASFESVPSSTSAILAAASSAAILEDNSIVSIELTGLYPDTEYSVFCTTEDLAAHVMPFTVSNSSFVTQQTACCRSLAFTKTYSEISTSASAAATNAAQLFEFVLEHPPLGPSDEWYAPAVVVAVDCSTGATLDSSVSASYTYPALSPIPNSNQAYYTFTATSAATISFALKTAVTTTPACYKVKVFVIGHGGEVAEALTPIVDIISTIPIPPAPIFSAAQFSNDGLSIMVTFDSPTDKGVNVGFLNAGETDFNCPDLVTYTTIASTVLCRWLTDSTFKIFLGANTLEIGVSTVRVFANVLRPICASDRSCTSDPVTAETTVTLSAPSNPPAPTVSLSAPTTIGRCDVIEIDPSTSFGQGSRDWANISWSCVASDPLLNMSASGITAHLNAGYRDDTSSVVEIPNTLLEAGDYTFSLTLTNFLGAKSIGTVPVKVSSSSGIPKVSVAGSPTRSMFRWQSINLFGVASVPECAVNSSKALKYTWKVFEGITYVPSLSYSESADQRNFKLPGYKFNSNTQYYVQVSVSSPLLTFVAPVGGAAAFAPQASELSSTAMVAVKVGQSGVVAVIKGGASRIVSSTVSLVLDGTSSYDVDYPTDATLLSFAWSCKTIAPTFGASCGLTGVDLSTSTITRAPANLIAEYTYEYTLIVRNAVSLQSASAVASITIVSQPLPAIEMLPIPVGTKYNAEDKIKILATVNTNGASSPTKCGWASVDDFPLTMNQIASTAAQVTIPPSSSTEPISIELAIKANSLVSGFSYAFALNAYYNNNPGSVSSASVTIDINTVPVNGILTVTPTSGQALTTLFSLQTSGWLDDEEDLPLEYSMHSYKISSSDMSAIRGFSILTYANNAILGQGLSSANYVVTCVVVAKDIWGGKASASTAVTVNPLADPIASIGANLGNQLSDAFTSTDASLVTQLISSASTALNTVDCGNMPVGATDCNTLHREECQDTANTCGACQSGYVGVSGDSNVPCTDPNARRRRLSSIKKVGEECSVNANCITGFCSSGICSDRAKSCPSDCTAAGSSFNGVCNYYDRNNMPLSFCGESDPYCSAKCECIDDKYGRDCSLSEPDFNSVIGSREAMCAGIYTSMGLNDFTSDFVVSTASNIAGVIKDASQLSDHALGNCTNALGLMITEVPDICGVDGVFEVLFDALDEVWTVITLPADTALTESEQEIATMQRLAMQHQAEDLTSLLSAARQSALANGETGTSVISSALRLYTAKDLASVFANGNVSGFVVPQNDFEQFNEYAPTVVTLNSTGFVDSSVSMGVTVIQHFKTAHNVSSNTDALVPFQNTTSVRLETQFYGVAVDYSAVAAIADEFTTVVELQNVVPIYYERLEPVVHTVYCGHSPDNDPFAYDHDPYDAFVICPISEGSNINGTILGTFELHYECPGTIRGLTNVTCPSLFQTPECTMWDYVSNSYQTNPLCEVVSYNAETTICECKGTNGRRRLATEHSESNSWDSFTNTITYEFSSRFGQDVHIFDLGFTPYDDPHRVIDATVGLTVSLLLICFGSLLCVFGYIDYVEYHVIIKYTEEIILGIGSSSSFSEKAIKSAPDNGFSNIGDLPEDFESMNDEDDVPKKKPVVAVAAPSGKNNPVVIIKKYTRTLDSFFAALLPPAFDMDKIEGQKDDGTLPPEVEMGHRRKTTWLDKLQHYLVVHNEYIGPFLYSLSNRNKEATENRIIDEIYTHCNDSAAVVNTDGTSSKVAGGSGGGDGSAANAALHHHYPHAFQWSKVAFRVLNIMVIATLLTGLLFPDDGVTCERITEENECTTRETMYSGIVTTSTNMTHTLINDPEAYNSTQQYTLCEWNVEDVYCTTRPAFNNYYTLRSQIFVVFRMISFVLMVCVPLNYICNNLLLHEATKVLGYWTLIKNDLMGKKRPRRNKTLVPAGASAKKKSSKVVPGGSLDDASVASGTSTGLNLSNMSSSFSGTLITLGDDELAASEGKKSRLMRAARFNKMQNEIDYTLPMDEVNGLLDKGYNGDFRFFSTNKLLLRLNQKYAKSKLMWWLVVFPVWLLDVFDGFYLRLTIYYFHTMYCVTKLFGMNNNVMAVPSGLSTLGRVMHHGVLRAYQIKTTNVAGEVQSTRWRSGIIEKEVQDIRLLSERLKNVISKMPDAVHRENYIMKSFILGNMSTSFKRRLAERYFYGSVEEHDYEDGGAGGGQGDPLYGRGTTTVKAKVHYSNSGYPYLLPLLSAVILGIYILGALYALYGYGISHIGSKSSKIWIIVVMFTLIEDIVCILPSYIYLLWIGIPSLISDEINGFKDLLYKKWYMIMRRTSGSVNTFTVHSLTQHMNPICRVARGFPELPVSRFLMSLNDFDLIAPTKSVHYCNRGVNSVIDPIVHVLFNYIPTVVFLQWWVYLPIGLQERSLEAMTILVFNGVLYILLVAAFTHISIMVVLVLLAVAFVFRQHILVMMGDVSTMSKSLADMRESMKNGGQVKTVYELEDAMPSVLTAKTVDGVLAMRKNKGNKNMRDEFTNLHLYTHDGLILRYALPTSDDLRSMQAAKEVERSKIEASALLGSKTVMSQSQILEKETRLMEERMAAASKVKPKLGSPTNSGKNPFSPASSKILSGGDSVSSVKSAGESLIIRSPLGSGTQNTRSVAPKYSPAAVGVDSPARMLSRQLSSQLNSNAGHLASMNSMVLPPIGSSSSVVSSAPGGSPEGGIQSQMSFVGAPDEVRSFTPMATTTSPKGLPTQTDGFGRNMSLDNGSVSGLDDNDSQAFSQPPAEMALVAQPAQPRHPARLMPMESFVTAQNSVVDDGSVQGSVTAGFGQQASPAIQRAPSGNSRQRAIRGPKTSAKLTDSSSPIYNPNRSEVADLLFRQLQQQQQQQQSMQHQTSTRQQSPPPMQQQQSMQMQLQPMQHQASMRQQSPPPMQQQPSMQMQLQPTQPLQTVQQQPRMVQRTPSFHAVQPTQVVSIARTNASPTRLPALINTTGGNSRGPQNARRSRGPMQG